jgi:hypothetical protein
MVQMEKKMDENREQMVQMEKKYALKDGRIAKLHINHLVTYPR